MPLVTRHVRNTLKNDHRAVTLETVLLQRRHAGGKVKMGTDAETRAGQRETELWKSL